MAKASPKVRIKKPENVFNRPLTFDFKDLFRALAKCAVHSVSGNWGEAGSDAVEALAAIGLSTDPGELAYILIRRSVTKALFDLVGESAAKMVIDAKAKEGVLIERVDFSMLPGEVHIDQKFLDRPSQLQLVKDMEPLLVKWLEVCGMPNPAAGAIAQRFPNYFIYALNQEWRRNAKSYKPLAEALNTPFARAGDREWAWAAYSALLQRRIKESIFDEPFSLSQIFVPLNAYYVEDVNPKDSVAGLGRTERARRRVVISLEQEMARWLENTDPADAIRVISGGPGSGKSSFARVFAARVAQDSKLKVLYVPLHLIDPSKDLVEEIGRFVKDEGLLLQNPLDPDSPEPNLLIIFDGLDELASQGKAAAETARAFVREVDRTVEKRNSQDVRLRVLIGGRELVVQENQSEFRRPRQILNLLPYFLAQPGDGETHLSREQEEYRDPDKLLEADLRHAWWKKYGVLTGRGFAGLPPELEIADLDEITAQPLLNYLVALSFTREKLDFKRDINLNSVYADLVAAVHERAYEKHRPYGPIRHMKLEDFSRVLEEIGLAAWHGDGRTTTVREIEDHCRASGLGTLLDAFEVGAKAGVTRLLAAFFFRQYGLRPSGDPTFVFTHKSFGEYLAAARIVRAMQKANLQRERRACNLDDGWDEREALAHWGRVCGPSGLSRYIRAFLLNEVRIQDTMLVSKWQGQFEHLFSYMLHHGMPMEQVSLGRCGEMMFHSRNAEEALLVALNACANVTRRVSSLSMPDPSAFGAWFKRIQGQRRGPESALVAGCMSFLDLSHSFLDIGDFFGSDMTSSNLQEVAAHFACFTTAILRNANLHNSSLGSSNFRVADMRGANLESADLTSADLSGAWLEGAKLRRATLRGADLRDATLDEADLREAALQEILFAKPGGETHRTSARRVVRTNLEGAKLRCANLEGANLEGSELAQAVLRGANLKGCNLRRANLRGADFAGSNLSGADLRGADRRGAIFRETILKGAKLRSGKSKRAEPQKRAARKS